MKAVAISARAFVLASLAGLCVACAPNERQTTVRRSDSTEPHTLQGADQDVQTSNFKTPFDQFPVKERVAMDNGVQVEVLRSGTSDKVVVPTSIVSVRYWGMLENGQIFDQTTREEFTRTLPLERLIEGWRSALPGMRVGSVWRVKIPSDLAYGELGLKEPEIPPHANLTYVIQLADVE